MDKLNFQQKTRTARNRLAEAVSRGNGTGSLAVPPSTLAINDNASTTGVNEGFPGQSAARDFAVPERVPVPQPRLEPPTSLQASVDAGKRVPVPPPKDVRTPKNRGTSSPSMPQRARSNSAPHRPFAQQRGSPQQQNSPYSRPSPGLRQASIGIRRMPSSVSLSQYAQATNLSSQRLSQPLDTLQEGCVLDRTPSKSSESTFTQPETSRLRKVRSAIQTKVAFWNSPSTKEREKSPEPYNPAAQGPADEGMNYTSDMVDVLDTLDPEVATLTSLTNLQNSLFIPNLPFFNRRPTYNLRRAPSETASLEEINRILAPMQTTEANGDLQPPRLRRTETEGTMATLATIDSQLSDSRYAVLPHGTSLDGWSKHDKAEVNDHVRHMLHSKRSKFKRSMRGFGQYVRRPLGFLVTLYATLITLFGLAWVLFLIGWINVGGQQIYVVHVIDSVLVALFAVVGDGLAPFRAIDTYHMIYIAHYHHFTWSRRKKDMLPALHDQNDLPSTNAPIAGPRTTDPEDPEKQWEFTVLTPKQQQKLEHHQEKFCKSHSFYKPHETETHHAFPLRLLVAIVVLLDCHSLLQISLGATTWGIYYKHRHFAITTVILICSITCNATAGLLIWLGDKRTRKTDVLERMNRQELTDEAIKKVEEKKKRERESESEGDELTRNERKGRISLDMIRKKTQGSSSGKSGKSAEPRPTAQNPYP